MRNSYVLVPKTVPVQCVGEVLGAYPFIAMSHLMNINNVARRFQECNQLTQFSTAKPLCYSYALRQILKESQKYGFISKEDGITI